MDETWLYHYDLETTQHSMERRHSGSPRPKKFWVQKSAGKALASIFGIKTASSSLIIFQRAKLSMPSITHLCWCNWKTFWMKNATGRLPRGSCSCTMPWLTSHLQPRKIGLAELPMSWSPTLYSGSGPIGLPPVPWAKKKQLEGHHFSSMGRSLLSRRPGWMDNLLNFFWVAWKS